MKVSSFWALFLVAGATLIFFNFSSPIGGSFSPADLLATNNGDRTTLLAVSRKLKENYTSTSSSKNKDDIDRVYLNDYHPIDPAPSSKAYVKPGPIQHGTPLMPYIPKPPPPAKS